MATFIAIVKTDGDAGYTASFPDYPGCAVGAPTVDHVIAKAREALSMHIERRLEANQGVCVPTAADAIERGDALLLAAVEVPDDLGIAHVELAIPALTLARIDAFAHRRGLTRSAIFVEAVNRLAMQESVPRERRGAISDGPTLFDFGNPLELRVEAITPAVEPQGDPATREPGTREAADSAGDADDITDITAELVRLLEERPEPQPTDRAVGEERDHPIREAE